MTYSIVARDPVTGELAVAVQSHYFSVGRVCPWARAGVGAVATQAMVDPGYGPLALSLLEGGKSPEAALRGLTAADPGQAERQVAILDADGNVATHTGERTIPEAGHRTGEGWSVQANMMLRNTVWDAMAAAFASSEGHVVERILAAFDAAEEEGGDVRGKQSSALLVVRGKRASVPGLDRTWDIRVEDHPEPVAELRRLVGLKRAYEGRAREGPVDIAALGRDLDEAAAASGGNPELAFWAGVSLAAAGRVDDARIFLERAYAVHPGWAELLKRLPATGRLPDDADLLRRLLPES